jgi:hypothetical protein
VRLTWKDGMATLFVAAVIAPYVGYLVRGEMPFVEDPRGMAGIGIVGLVFGFVAWGLGLRSLFGKALLVLGLASLGLGIAAALVGAEGSEVLLAVFIGSIVVVWLGEMLFHSGVIRAAH